MSGARRFNSGIGLSRRELLAFMGSGTLALAASRSMLSTLVPIARAASTGTVNRRLALFIAPGGIRSMDFCDAFSGDVDVEYTSTETSEIHDGWSLPPQANACSAEGVPLEKLADQLALIRNVYMETASHDVGLRYALTGANRNSYNAGPVVCANADLVAPETRPANLSFSFGWALPRYDLDGPIVGEPATLATWMVPPAFQRTASSKQREWSALYADAVAAANAQLIGLVAERNEASANGAASGSKLRVYRDVFNSAREATDAAIGSMIYDSATVANYTGLSYTGSGGLTRVNATLATRAHGAFRALSTDAASVVTVATPTSFDTHEGSQYDNCAELASVLGRFLADLRDAPDPRDETKKLLPTTTVLVMSDFDRTYKFNDETTKGTDHYPWGSILIAGGELTAGVYDPFSAAGTPEFPGQFAVAAEAYTRKSIWATIYQLFGLEPNDWFTGASTISGLYS